MPYKDKKRQKIAQAEWYQKNKDDIRAKRKVSRQEARQWVYEYKLNNSICADCKQSFPPHILDFDHLRDKSFGISRALKFGTNLDKIKDEIEKCEIVCANCHRHRTFTRLNDNKAA